MTHSEDDAVARLTGVHEEVHFGGA